MSRLTRHTFFGLLLLRLVGPPDSAAQAQVISPVDPAFNALNNTFTTTAGTFNVNTTTAQISGPAGYTATGLLYNPGGGQTIAVFDFNTLTIAANQILSVTGNNPLALLSRATLTVAAGAQIVLSGGDGAVINGGAGGPGGRAGGGIFSNGLGPGGGGVGGGGGFGGAGGNSFFFKGGVAYGDLRVKLEGGSGGGGNGAGAGGGGGALHLSAVGDLSVSGTGGVYAISAHGGLGGSSGSGGSGGGSGGGVLLNGATVVLSGTAIDVSGGAGGTNSGGGGGGGGRVVINVGDPAADYLSFVKLNGGAAGIGTSVAQPGGIGVLQVAVVPEPSPWGLAAVALTVAAAFRTRRAVPART